MPHTVSSVLAEVIRIAPSLHKAGTFSTATLEAIVRHASMKPVQHSAEFDLAHAVARTQSLYDTASLPDGSIVASVGGYPSGLVLLRP